MSQNPAYFTWFRIEIHPSSLTDWNTAMTVILTLVGIIVFFISLITTKFDFKTSFIRLLMFTGAGLVLDVLFGLFFAAALYGYPL